MGLERKDFAGLGGDFGLGVHGGHGGEDVVEDGVGVGGIAGDAGDAEDGGLVEVVVADLGDGDVKTVANTLQHAFHDPPFFFERAVAGEPQVHGEDADYHAPSVRRGTGDRWAGTVYTCEVLRRRGGDGGGY